MDIVWWKVEGTKRKVMAMSNTAEYGGSEDQEDPNPKDRLKC